MPSSRSMTTDAEIDAAIAQASAREQEDLRVTSARYDDATDRILITLATGIEVAVPRRLLQGLGDATPAQLATIEIQELGQGLHWPSLNVDHYVPGILEGIFGTRRWMSEIGRKGGSVRSDRKARAARRNGRLGGRPRNKPVVPLRAASASAREQTKGHAAATRQSARGGDREPGGTPRVGRRPIPGHAPGRAATSEGAGQIRERSDTSRPRHRTR